MPMAQGIWRTVMLCAGIEAAIAQPGYAALRLPPVFSDNMVLQQGMDVPVWGTGTPQDTVTVAFAGQRVTATVAGDNTWRTMLKPLHASSVPAEMTVTDARGETIRIANVVVGEVWLCSGQSNMELPVKDCLHAAKEIAGGNDPLIRVYGNQWVPVAPDTVGSFTAIGYFFARDLRQRLHVPVGILSKSVGGTPIQAWLSWHSARQATAPLLAAYTAQIARQRQALQKDKASYEKDFAARQARAVPAKMAWIDRMLASDIGAKEKWYEPGTSLEKWQRVTIPMPDGLAGWSLYGTTWARRDVDLPPALVGRPLLLNLGAMDDADITYVNGTEVGRTWYGTKDFWKIPRHYPLTAAQTRSRHLTIVTRIPNIYGVSGMFGQPQDWSITTADGSIAISLAGSWHFRFGSEIDPGSQPQVLGAGEFGNLYEALIHPLAPFGLRGVLWYQAENNAFEPALYAQMFPVLIQSWRQVWGRKDLPFYFVQLAAYMGKQITPIEKYSWANVREAQAQGLALPDTGMVVTTDIGDADSIHPRNKQEVARRLELWALAKEYHQDIECSGPTYRSMKVHKGKIVVTFDHANGLHNGAGPGPLHGFAIAGQDKVFHWAQAEIAGDTVVLSSPIVPEPVAARYNWAANPAGDLINDAGLPASQFRTDHWRPQDIPSSSE